VRQTTCDHCGQAYYWQRPQDTKEHNLVSRKFSEHLKNAPLCAARQRVLENLFFKTLMQSEFDQALLPIIEQPCDLCQLGLHLQPKERV